MALFKPAAMINIPATLNTTTDMYDFALHAGYSSIDYPKFMVLGGGVVYTLNGTQVKDNWVTSDNMAVLESIDSGPLGKLCVAQLHDRQQGLSDIPLDGEMLWDYGQSYSWKYETMTGDTIPAGSTVNFTALTVLLYSPA